MPSTAGGSGVGALVNVISVAAEDLTDFEDWYTFEHFPERLAVPGFRQGRRYVETQPEPGARPLEFFSIYETDDVATLTSPAYLAALDSPTEWTQRVAPTFAGNERSVGELHAIDGVGRSGRIAVLRFSPVRGEEDRVRRAVADALGAALASRSIVHGYLVAGDSGATAAKDATAEGRSMAGSSGARWYAVAELHSSASRVDPSRLRELLLVGDDADAITDVRIGEYRLVVERGV